MPEGDRPPAINPICPQLVWTRITGPNQADP